MGAIAVVVVERRWLGDVDIFVELRVLVVRFPVPVWCLVVVHEKERPLSVPPLQPVQTQVGYQICGVSRILDLLTVADHLRIEVGPLPLQDVPVVETGRPVVGPLAQMPLADNRRLVAVALEDLGDVLQTVVEVGANGGDTVDVVVGAGQDAGPARLAQGVGAEAVVESHPLSSDAVEVGGLVDAAAITAHGVGGVIVGHDEEDVGLGHDSTIPSYSGLG